MRKYFLELFAIGLVDSEGTINTEHMTSDALMTSMKTMEELTKMKMDRLVLETTMEMILCMFESCDTEEFTEILGKLLGGKQTSKVTAHLEALEELLTEEEYRGTGIKQTGRVIVGLLLVKKQARIRAEKEGGYAKNEKLNLSYGRGRKYLTKLSAFESEIHPSHKLHLCSAYFALLGAIVAGNGSWFVNGCRCIHSQIIWQNLLCRRQGGSAYRKKFIYSNDKTKQCKRQNHLYIQSRKIGKSLCSL